MFTNGFNLAAADEDHLVGQKAAGIHIQEFSGANDRDLHRRLLLCRRNRSTKR